MSDKRKILFLCTGNSARSIISEVLANELGKGRIHAFSAGSKPTGKVNPDAIKVLIKHGHNAENIHSKSWDDFAGEKFDVVVTVCDNAAKKPCPFWPGAPERIHWGIDDPAAAKGSESEKMAAFETAYKIIRAKIETLL